MYLFFTSHRILWVDYWNIQQISKSKAKLHLPPGGAPTPAPPVTYTVNMHLI